MTEIKWQEPPADRRGNRTRGSQWDLVADELRRNPGRWALVKSNTTDASLPKRIKDGRLAAFANGTFEATGRGRIEDGQRKFDIYARCVEATS